MACALSVKEIRIRNVVVPLKRPVVAKIGTREGRPRPEKTRETQSPQSGWGFRAPQGVNALIGERSGQSASVPPNTCQASADFATRLSTM